MGEGEDHCVVAKRYSDQAGESRILGDEIVATSACGRCGEKTAIGRLALRHLEERFKPGDSIRVMCTKCFDKEPIDVKDIEVVITDEQYELIKAQAPGLAHMTKEQIEKFASEKLRLFKTFGVSPFGVKNEK